MAQLPLPATVARCVTLPVMPPRAATGHGMQRARLRGRSHVTHRVGRIEDDTPAFQDAGAAVLLLYCSSLSAGLLQRAFVVSSYQTFSGRPASGCRCQKARSAETAITRMGACIVPKRDCGKSMAGTDAAVPSRRANGAQTASNGAQWRLHAQQSELRVCNGSIARGCQAQCQHAARVGGGGQAVGPQTRRGVVGMALGLILAPDRGFEGFFLLHAPLAALGLDAVALDPTPHPPRLLAPPHPHTCVGPHPQEARAVRPAAHAVVARAKAAAD